MRSQIDANLMIPPNTSCMSKETLPSINRSTSLDATLENTCSCVLSVPKTWSNVNAFWCGTTLTVVSKVLITSDSVDWENRGCARS